MLENFLRCASNNKNINMWWILGLFRILTKEKNEYVQKIVNKPTNLKSPLFVTSLITGGL